MDIGGMAGMIDMGTMGSTGVSSLLFGSSKGVGAVTEKSGACSSRATSRSGTSGQGTGITGSRILSLCACSPGADDLGEGGGGPEDDVTVGGGLEKATPEKVQPVETRVIGTVGTVVRV